MKFEGRCYRGHDPRWSYSPLSGAGAARTGGRFNRKGESALYLALDIMTAVNECAQGLGQRLQPLVICEYDVDCEPVADCRAGAASNALGVEREDLACAWLNFLLAGKDAPSWIVADRLKADGFVGMLAPSFAPGATTEDCNLVLWRWGRNLPTRVAVYDPSGRLPKDQTSWS